MNDVDNKVKMIIEGLLLAAGRPLPLESIAAVFNEEERPENDELLGVLARIDEECGDRGFELTKVASGYRFQVKQELAEWVGKLWEERPPRYTRALLETLALVAYRQPITRGDIEEIRGVAVSSNIIRTLLDREWIRVVGQRDVPGRPSMFATTKQFLDYFNLESLQQLPALSEIRDIDGGAKDLGFEAELAAARVLEMPENAEDDASIELSDDEKAEMLAEEEAIALSQKPLDEILHPNGRPDLQGTEDDEEDAEEDAEENDDFAEIDEALAALEEDLGGDPSRLGEAIAGERNEGQLSSEESEGGSDDAVPTE
ncbi:SMC-Scp complex subunit ScpB [Gammaproteobacteria bacterium]|nr:SMC-Scp complex subunit ScpB [Gammaproteobacteria bacterium]